MSEPQEFKVHNEFGILPTNTARSAGLDFYVPDLTIKDISYVPKEWYNKVFAAITADSGYTDQNINEILRAIKEFVVERVYEHQHLNILLLFLSFSSETLDKSGVVSLKERVRCFVNNYLTFDQVGLAGVCFDLNSTMKVNTGIRVALPHGYAGVFLNKSGMGNRGFDVRSQVVDEDFTGYVFASVAMTKPYVTRTEKNVVFCGDKLLQMLLLPCLHTTPVNVSEEEYFALMEGAERGENCLGSSDIVHQNEKGET